MSRGIFMHHSIKWPTNYSFLANKVAFRVEAYEVLVDVCILMSSSSSELPDAQWDRCSFPHQHSTDAYIVL